MLVVEEDTLHSNAETDSSVPIINIDPETVNLKVWTELVLMNNHYVEFKMDTGAEVDVIPKKVLDKLFQKNYKLQPTEIILEVYGGALLRPIGTIDVNCVLNNIELKLSFVVADVESVPLLGLESCERFGLVKRTPRVHSVKVNHIYKVSLCVAHNGHSYFPCVETSPKTVTAVSTVNLDKRRVTFATPLITVIPDGNSANSDVQTKQDVIQKYANVFIKSAGKLPHKSQLKVDP